MGNYKDYSERIGEINKATNGRQMEIIRYGSSSDIDVKFDDGKVVCHKNYVDFKRGKIGYPKESKVGKVNTTKSGMQMKVIEYRKYDDIDIEFEDGTIVYHKRYSCFKKGEIAYPYDKRLGESAFARNGMMMKIIRYENAGDIDVEFEDGTVVKNRKYVDFIYKKIGYPKPNRVGEEVMAKNGMLMKIIEYRNSRDVDVEFEDGTIVKNKEYKCFKQGTIHNPNIYMRYIGEENIARNGYKMKIVAFRKYNDIDIEFEDGQVVYGKDYYSFCIGNIGYPIKSRVGEENTANNGMRMKIIEYRNSSDIDIEFENGVIVEHKSYLNFKNGYIGYPRPNHIGEENVSKNGLKMKVIDYRNSSDIDIEFEDSVIVKHRSYQNFKKGAIYYPIKNRVGEHAMANNGMKMTIVSYRSATDIDVEFEDGTIVENKGYKEFKRGQIGHPFVSVHRSLPEKIICYFAGKKYDYIANFKPNWLLNNRFCEESRKNELDIFIPDKRIAIEYDGVRYHQIASKDNKKSKCVFSNKQIVNKFIRIREKGCPEIQKYENMLIYETRPFSIYHKESIEDLESVIKVIMQEIDCNDYKIEITPKIVEFCRSEEFFKKEIKMRKRLQL